MEYLLIYDANYQKYSAKKTIRLVRENDAVKIIGYNIYSEGFLK